MFHPSQKRMGLKIVDVLSHVLSRVFLCKISNLASPPFKLEVIERWILQILDVYIPAADGIEDECGIISSALPALKWRLQHLHG